MRCSYALVLTGALTLGLAGLVTAQSGGSHSGKGNGNAANQVAAVDLFEAAPMPVSPQAGFLHMRVGNFATANLPNLLKGEVPAEPHVPGATIPGAGAGSKTRWVIQLDSTITPAREQQLAQLGVTLADYLPTNAYIASLGDEPIATAQQLVQNTPFVTWVGAYQNAWKIDPEIGRPAGTWQTEERQQIAQADRVIVDVTLFYDADVQQAQNLIAAIPNVQVYKTETQPCAFTIPGDNNQTFTIVTLQAPVDAMQALAAIADVQYIENAPEITLRSNNNTRWIVQTNQTNLEPVYAAGVRGQGQIVGVLDGRVNHNHCSFRDTVNPIGNSHRKIQAYNTSLGYDSHGTHVSGTAIGDAGVDDNTRGIAYEGRLCYGGIPSFSEFGVYNALNLHHTQGARAHTNSWGNDGTTSYDSLCRGIDNFCWIQEESLVCLAVTNTSSLKNPENAKNLLAVGATGPSGSQQNWCTGGQGPTNDGRRKPEIYAPGCSTLSSSGSGTSCSTGSQSGTSMASPAIAGVGLLVRQYYADGYYPSGAANAGDAFVPTGALVKATIINGGVDMTGVTGYPSNREGWGRVLIDDSLSFTGETRTLVVKDFKRTSPGALTTGNVVEYPFMVSNSSQKLKVTLAWTDAPATSGSNPAYINNLDLEIVTPGGTLYRGNVFSSGLSTTGGSADSQNNVEQVHLNSPATGQWIARIKATSIPTGPQGYSLVISGAVDEGPVAPANDNCSNATLVGGGPTAFTTVAATTDGPNEIGGCNFGGYTHIDNDVWFRFVSPCTGQVTVSVCGSDFDTKMAAYNSCPTAPNQTIACNDNACGTSSQMTFAVTDGQAYFVRVGGFNGATGSGAIAIDCTPCAADLTGIGGSPDGIVDVSDLFLLLSNWNNNGPGANLAPPNDVIDVSDLFVLLAAWGDC